jgi:FAD/FMN-containing dehydrogenase
VLTAGSLTDFGRLARSADPFFEVCPPTPQALAEIVRAAYQKGRPLRTRGQGHSMNASSLPGTGELLVRTTRLGSVRFERPGTVSADAGIVLWSLDLVLQEYGFTLPVRNDGYAAPSLGGFLAAGGYGLGSASHGGFWENVAGLTLIDGRGTLRTVRRGESLFPWVFGSMGQLGIVTEVTLDILPLPGAGTPRYPLGEVRSGEEIAAAPHLRGPGPPPEEQGRSLFWFTWFVPGKKMPRALVLRAEHEAAFAGLLRFRPPYMTGVTFREIVPMLIFPHAAPFFAVGSWGFADALTPDVIAGLHTFDNDFSRIARENGFHRYVQTEITSGPAAYRSIFGEAVYSAFGGWKARLDPASIFNRGTVFPAP